jgi:hypothetical protein
MARKAALPPSARKILQAERRKLDKLRGSSADQRITKAREEMERAAQRHSRGNLIYRANENIVTATRKHLQGLTQAVAASWGVTTPITLSAEGELSAWTDFKTIFVAYPWGTGYRSISVKGDGDSTLIDIDHSYIARAIIEVKAAVYHEVGHILFTIPWTTFVEDYNAAMGFRIDALNQEMRRLWNVLEDQRQEAALIASSPIVATYLTALIARWFTVCPELWLLVTGRHYLPKELRTEARSAFADLYGEADADEVAQIVADYCAATTVAGMGDALMRLYALVEDRHINTHRAQSSGAKHSHIATNDRTPDPGQSATSAPQEPTSSEPSSSEPSGDDDEIDSDSDAEMGGAGGEGYNYSDDQGASQPGVGSKPMTARELQAMIKGIEEAARETLAKDKSVVAEVKEVVESFDMLMKDPLGRHETAGKEASPEWVAEADVIAYDMQRAFETRTANSAPMWQHRTTRGVVDSFAYRTREPGTKEFYRMFDDRGDLGRDIAVSVLLDVSGSMGGLSREISVGGYAIASACRALDIPVNVMTFGSFSNLLYGAEDRELTMAHIVPNGSTYPDDALEALDFQMYSKSQHLVFILTDGEWPQGSMDILGAKNSGLVNRRTFILGFRLPDSAVNKFTNYGVEEALQINDLRDMPLMVQNTIVNYVG